MTLAGSHPRISIAAAAAALVLAGLALLATTGSSASRGALLGALERPAEPAAMPAPAPARATLHDGRAIIRVGVYTATLQLTPNLASARNRVSVALSLGGRPLSGAAVTVTFGMPAMGMSDAYASSLPAHGGSTYATTEPVLGMPGVWVLHVHVVPGHAAPVDVAARDLLIH